MSFIETLEYDPITKIKTVFHGDGDQYTIETLQDVTDIVEANKLLYNDVDQRARYGEHMQRVASIPVGVGMQMYLEGKMSDTDYLLKWLDDNDQLAFRTRPGKLSR